MATKKEATKKDEKKEVKEFASRLLVNNVTKEHVLAINLPGGVVGVVPVVVRDDAHIDGSFTEVTE